jgi:exonuclease SbcC
MLPIRLELRNFLAYRAPAPLDFTGFELACLSGPNGAGKSSLLDAITWALWGEARARSDDDLIHIGQDEMHIIFDFRQDQALYRVVRKRSRKGRGQTSLDLFAWDDSNHQFRLISESTVRETQNRITQLLRLDYDTFVHSAFLQQGKADAFTVKTPTERKKILGEILGLARWQVYEEQAKQSLQGIGNELGIINGSIADMEKEEQREPALLRELDAATVQVEDARQAREAAEDRFTEVAGAPATMQTAQAQLVAAQRRVQQYEHDLATLQAELEHQRRRLADYQQVIAARQTIEEGYARLELARQTDHELADKLMQRADAEQRLHELESVLYAERADLETQAGLSLGRIQEAEQTLTNGDSLAAEIAEIEAEMERLEARSAEHKSLLEARQALSEETATLRERNKALHTEMTDIKNRLSMIETAGEAICPVCRQPLDEPHRAELEQQYKAEGKVRGDTYRANEARLKTIASTLAAYEETIREIDAELRQYDALKAEHGALHERISTIRQAAQRLDVERVTLEEIRRKLSEEDYGLELRAEIIALREQIDGLGYDKDTHHEARETLKAMHAFEVQKRELDTALQSLPDVETHVRNLQARYERYVAQLAEASAEVAALEQQIEELAALVQEAQRRQADVMRLRTDERRATERLISVQQQLNAIEALRRRKLDLQARREELCNDEAIYQQLKEAFGRNGIPAMIIEAAIPELEAATNKLLARMTDGRMHVRFDTQRAKKSGDGVIDTLDILISDELGTRTYDMFSGGESFRVNFALRIALSEFLAHRAGARLQTLVIDEGFGSQDDVGRERLIEAINAIKNDFDLILIVTHIEELRDHFPVRIEIRKGASGSTIEVR